MYLGDFSPDINIDFKFTTVNTSSVPTTLAGSPVVSVYIDNSTTQTTTGATLTVDFDGVTGLNHVRIATTAAFYVPESSYQVVITVGTVGGVSVVGYVLAHFSIGRKVRGVIAGICDSGSTTTSIIVGSVSTPTGAPSVTDQFKGRIMIFDSETTTANLRGQATDITANTAGGTFTVTALTTAPVINDTFVIV